MFPKNFFTVLFAIVFISIDERGLQAMRSSARGGSSSSGGEKIFKSLVVFQVASDRACDAVLTMDTSNKPVVLTDSTCWNELNQRLEDGVRGKISEKIILIGDVSQAKIIGHLAILEATGGELMPFSWMQVGAGKLKPWLWSPEQYAATVSSNIPQLGTAGFGIKREPENNKPTPWRAVIVKNEKCGIGQDQSAILFCVQTRATPQPGPGSPFYMERDDGVEEVLGVRKPFDKQPENSIFFTYIATYVLAPHED